MEGTSTEVKTLKPQHVEKPQPVVCLLYTSPSPETVLDLVCRLLLEKKKKTTYIKYGR